MPDQYSEQSDHLPDPRTPIAGARCPSTGFISSGRNRCPATQWPTGTDPRIHQLHERSQFSSPRQLPVRPLAASDRHVRSAHDHQPPVSPTAISPFSCHRTTPSTASPAPCSWRRSAGPSSGFRSPRGPGRLPFFHETGSRSERTGAIRPQQHLLC